MEIEQKDRERIEAETEQFLNMGRFFGVIRTVVKLHMNTRVVAEHLHLQKEVIQPLRWDVNAMNAANKALSMQIKILDSHNDKLEAEIKALMEAAETLRAWLDPDVAESENKTFLNDVAKLDQLLTKNEG